MRHTEFWARLDHTLGTASSRSWAELYVIGELGSRTVVEALSSGAHPKQVWAAVWRVLDLPDSER